MAELVESGAAFSWMARADEHTRRVAGKFNGPLAEELLRGAGCAGASCPDIMRDGYPMVGLLPKSRSGTPAEFPPAPSLADFRADARRRNTALTATLKSDADPTEICQALLGARLRQVG